MKKESKHSVNTDKTTNNKKNYMNENETTI
jgi:hypothetical protein